MKPCEEKTQLLIVWSDLAEKLYQTIVELTEALGHSEPDARNALLDRANQFQDLCGAAHDEYIRHMAEHGCKNPTGSS